MEARYRKDYTGEFIVTKTVWSGGQKQQEREWINNPIINQHISGRAACIASDVTRGRFDYTRLQRHRGGILSSKKLQTYGVSSVAHDMRLDFVIDTRIGFIDQLIEKEYDQQGVIYSTPRNCLLHPGKLYPIPYLPNLKNEALCAYLAAFDGHEEIFMFGYSVDTPSDSPGWYNDVTKVIRTYKTTKFYFVGVTGTMYDEWLASGNAELMSFEKFITYCDVR